MTLVDRLQMLMNGLTNFILDVLGLDSALIVLLTVNNNVK